MSDPTIAHIRSLHPELQPYVAYFVDSLRSVGVPLLVISGRRTPSRNLEVGGVPRSMHLQGLAFDAQVAGLHRERVPPELWELMGQFWESMGGRWGGRFGRPDVNHFDVGPVIEV